MISTRPPASSGNTPSVEAERESHMPGFSTCMRHGVACAHVFILIMLIWGCTGHLAVGALKRLPDTLPHPSTYHGRLTALAQIDLATGQGNYPLRAAVVVQSPSWLRLEILPLIGTPDLYLTASPDRLSVFIPSRREFYSGKPTVENLSRFLPWPVSLEEMVAILSGNCFSPTKGYVSCLYPETENSVPDRQKPLTAGTRAAQPAGGFLKELVRYDEGRNEIYRVSFDDYRSDIARPGRIVLGFIDGSIRLNLRYTDMKLEAPADMSVFELSAPAGLTIIELDNS